jgi:hypothetical protein
MKLVDEAQIYRGILEIRVVNTQVKVNRKFFLWRNKGALRFA